MDWSLYLVIPLWFLSSKKWWCGAAWQFTMCTSRDSYTRSLMIQLGLWSGVESDMTVQCFEDFRPRRLSTGGSLPKLTLMSGGWIGTWNRLKASTPINSSPSNLKCVYWADHSEWSLVVGAGWLWLERDEMSEKESDLVCKLHHVQLIQNCASTTNDQEELKALSIFFYISLTLLFLTCLTLTLTLFFSFLYRHTTLWSTKLLLIVSQSF